MPFDWMQPKVNADFSRKIAGRFNEMHLVEIEQRACLLHRLRFDGKKAAKRIRDNIEWEFELSKVPAFARQVKSIVDRVYKRKAQ